MKSIHCWNCGQRLENIHQLQNVRSVGIALFGRCPGCGEDVPCADLLVIKQVIDKRTGRDGYARGTKNNRTDNRPKICTSDPGDPATSSGGRPAETKRTPGMGSEKLDHPTWLVFGGLTGSPDSRTPVQNLDERDRTQKDQEERKVTK